MDEDGNLETLEHVHISATLGSFSTEPWPTSLPLHSMTGDSGFGFDPTYAGSHFCYVARGSMGCRGLAGELAIGRRHLDSRHEKTTCRQKKLQAHDWCLIKDM